MHKDRGFSWMTRRVLSGCEDLQDILSCLLLTGRCSLYSRKNMGFGVTRTWIPSLGLCWLVT